MTANEGRPAAIRPPQALGRLRLRLTAWYVGTFFAILLLLGVGMFATITRRFDRDLDASLRDATRELVRLAHVRDRQAGNRATLLDPIDDVRIPDRTLLFVDSLGRPETGDAPDAWLQELARDAARRGAAGRVHSGDREHILRAYAERVTLSGRGTRVAIAVADEIELEDRYASLIAAFGGAAFASLVLVAAGGWLLARQSTEPVERVINHMRRFMADAAHELRTPLAVVRSQAEVALQRTRDPDAYVTALRSIERESERLGGIVEDLLMLARADAGERPIERKRVFLDDVTLDAADAVRVIAERKPVRLEVEDFEEAAVDGDPALLRQLVVILLDNAIKFTDPNGVIRVSVRGAAAGAVLTVSDTGIGIDPANLPHVFDRFYRGDPARTRAGSRENGSSEGVGLGLSIARWIAEEHHGTIAIDSQPGEGTQVVVEFPLAVLSQTMSSS